ncbi:hypothetical protein DCM91_14675 [Chitinophaga costaii]|nr:hypothetical protein DCM91_14675 [Chitinophaga costaii]
MKIFSNHTDRQLFISHYDFSATDRHNRFYKSFVDDHCLAENTDMLIAVMELSMKMDYFKEELVNQAWSVYETKKFFFRLNFLDYLFFFKNKIDAALYLEINEAIFTNSLNVEVTFQAAINLYDLTRYYAPYLYISLKRACRSSDYYIFYKIVQFLEEEKGLNDHAIVLVYVKELLNDACLILPGNHRLSLMKRLEQLG